MARRSDARVLFVGRIISDHSQFTIHDSRLNMSSPHELFRRLTTGVYVVTASHERQSDGFTAAWVTQVAFDPLLVALSVNPGNATWPLMQRSGRFVLNVLKAEQHDAARHFGTTSGRDTDKMSNARLTTPDGAAIVLADAAAWLECRVEQQISAGDHVVVIARVIGGDVLDPGAAVLHYADTGNMDGSATLYPPAFADASNDGT
jgi:flavin reductase (DIM6/NTAB) family NADH-FMN oxidoreductase RutF